MTVPPLRIAIAGTAGRLGSEIRELIAADDSVELAFALVRPGGSRPEGVPYFEHLQDAHPDFDVLIDVALADGMGKRLTALRALNKPLVTGVTGLRAAQQTAVHDAANSIAVLQAANFSQGITALLAQVRDMARRLGSDWQVEISETHHVHKKDYPSGTALALARVVQDGLGDEIPIISVLWPENPQSDSPAITIQSYRREEVFGEHEVRFSCGSESVVLGHTANSRAVFAHGALAAAKWIAGKPAGFYTMEDVGENAG